MKDRPIKKLSGLREEWSLLVHSIVDDQDGSDSVLDSKKINFQGLPFEEVQNLKKNFSQKRNSLNLQIENIKKRIDYLFSVLENLELVGSKTNELKSELTELNQQGEKISTEINLLDTKLNQIHALEDQLQQAISENS